RRSDNTTTKEQVSAITIGDSVTKHASARNRGIFSAPCYRQNNKSNLPRQYRRGHFAFTAVENQKNSLINVTHSIRRQRLTGQDVQTKNFYARPWHTPTNHVAIHRGQCLTTGHRDRLIQILLHSGH
ncbi:hypothetical protein ALC56_03596, partial [Trachymyrmex septentrionalis]